MPIKNLMLLHIFQSRKNDNKEKHAIANKLLNYFSFKIVIKPFFMSSSKIVANLSIR